MDKGRSSLAKIIAACALATMFVATQFAQNAEVRFVTGEWAPYTSERMSGFGAASEIVSAACAAVGLKAAYDFVPWKRAEQNVADGTAFAAFPYFLLPERVAKPDVFAHSDPLFSSVMGILYYKKNPSTSAGMKFDKVEDLKGRAIGALAGTVLVSAPLSKAGIKFEETPDVAASIKKLALGRLELVIEDRAVLWDAVKAAFPSQLADFAFLDKNFTEKSATHLLVSKKFPGSDALLAKFNEGMKKIKADGTLKKIYDKYGLVL